MADTATAQEVLQEYRKIARLGSRRAGYLFNTTVACLCTLGRAAASETIRLQACKLLLETEAVRERLHALTAAAGRRSSSTALTEKLEEQLTALLSEPGGEDKVRDAFKEALMPIKGKPQ